MSACPSTIPAPPIVYAPIPTTVDVLTCRDCGSTTLMDTSHRAGNGCRAKHEDDCHCGEERCDDCHSTAISYRERPTWHPDFLATLAAYTAGASIDEAEALCIAIDEERWQSVVEAIHATTPGAEYAETGRMFVHSQDDRRQWHWDVIEAAEQYAANLRAIGCGL